MNATEFGRQLIETRDLDPIYVMLNNAPISWDTKARFCLAYWMFYHAGVAARIAEPDEDFWDSVWLAQDNKWPRGTERRHFKARNSENAIDYMMKWLQDRNTDSPEVLVGWLIKGDGPYAPPVPYTEIRDRVMTLVGFGPWIAFKVADMIDAVLETEVSFQGAEQHFFDDPLKGGCWVAMETMGMEFNQITFTDRYKSAAPAVRTVNLKAALNYLASELGMLVCPHNPTRTLRLQEYETILCKYKSHLNGHYEVGKDTREILKALSEWESKCILAGTLKTALTEVTK
jgi:hypothetical protein